ncbi:hypothetical protein EJB05_46859, partial [Eragrostis curvula]
MKIIYGIFSPTSSITTGTPSSAAAGLPSCGSSPPSVSRLRRLPRRAKSRAVPPPLRCASSGSLIDTCICCSVHNASVDDNVTSSGMEAAGTAMYPLHRCKTIYLVRHAQGIHNVEGEKDPSAYIQFDVIFKVFLTTSVYDEFPSGCSCNLFDGLREHVKKCGLAKKVELVITSPLLRYSILLTIPLMCLHSSTENIELKLVLDSCQYLRKSTIRTMQTAVGVFGGDNYTHGASASPLMVENAGHSGRPAIENDEDVLWEPDVREANVAVAARGMKFIDWATILIPCFFNCISLYRVKCLRRTGCLLHFYAALQIVSSGPWCWLAEACLGPIPPSFNYLGKVPPGLDLPSDVVDKKLLEEAPKN